MDTRSKKFLFLALPALLAGAASSANAATVTGEARRAAPANDPVSNARITIFDPTLSFFAEARTDSAGAYSIANVPVACSPRTDPGVMRV